MNVDGGWPDFGAVMFAQRHLPCRLFLAALLAVRMMAGPGTAQDNPSTGLEPVSIPEVARDKLICFALYTTHKNTLKLSAFFYPLKDDDERTAVLEVQREGEWRQVAEAPVEEMGWMAFFRVDKWDMSKDTPYRVKHAGGAVYEGRVRRDPVDKDEIVVATFSSNGGVDRGPRADIIANIRHHDPDLLFFSGDQGYDYQDHLASWLKFGRQFGDICRDRPVVAIPADHDVGHPSLWGGGGAISRRPDGADGGYFTPVPYVNMVQRAQCSHLPDPADPTPVKNGITVYYTSLRVGGVDFAILEDRKWKSGPAGLLRLSGPRLEVIREPGYDRQALDVPEAELLGARQIKFLRAWGQDWSGATMKAVLSQTPFASAVHVEGEAGERILADFDSNGWPQSGRNAALREMRRAFAVHLCGHQQTGAVFQYGINAWGDAPFAFVAPAIASYYPRAWLPLEKPAHPFSTGALPHIGDYIDGFGNKLTMHAHLNAVPENAMGNGHGIVRFKKSKREITFELWPRNTDATKDQPAKGWPITIPQQANYHRAPLAWLPTLKITGAQDPVVQIIDETTDDVVYTLRIPGTQFRPKVFRHGTYTVHIGEGEHKATLRDVPSLRLIDPEQSLEVIVP